MSSTSFAGVAPPRPARDSRLDLVRGWLQLTIFASHATGSWIGAWMIHGTWGLSDSSEQFVFLSGLTLGSVFDYKLARYGRRLATRDMLLRALRLYRVHMLVLLLFAALMLATRAVPTLAGQAAALHWTYLFANPVSGIAGAFGLIYQPAYMDILPVFIVGTALLPAFALLVSAIGNWALLAPLSLYAGVQIYDLHIPALGDRLPGFNVLAWQVLFMAGVWLGGRLRRGEVTLPRSPVLIGVALLILLAGLALRLIEHGLVPLHLALPDGRWLSKTDLGPPLMLHGLALAFLVARLMPRDARWMRWRPLDVLAAMGRHSLQVFCLGIFLSWGCSVLYARLRYSVALDVALLAAGTGVLGLFALFIEQPPAILRGKAMRPAAPAVDRSVMTMRS